MNGWWSRLAPLTGLVFAGLVVASFAASGSTPNADASPQHVVSFYEAHRHGQMASAVLIAYAVLFGVFFGAALRSYMRARSSSDGLMAVGFAGIVVFAVGASTLAGLNFAAADVPSKIDPVAEQALNVAQNDVFYALFVGMALFFLGFGLAIARTRALPAWLGWVAVAFGVVAATPIGWFMIFALLGWTVVVSVLMFLREGQAPSTAAAAPA
jgi:hypothetical protein